MRPDGTELCWLPAWRLRELIVGRELSPAEVTRYFLDRITALDPGLRCFVTVAADEALEAARRLQQRSYFRDPGPLYGVPVSVKDQYWTQGIRTTGGSRLYRDWVPEEDACCVRRAREAGAVIIGKTNTPEFALWWRAVNHVAPLPRNPWQLGRTAGGSSSGAAASVAAGLTPVAIGSDCAGSIRLPAAFCGVTGLLPTSGRVPRHGGLGGSLQFTGIGPITRDARDAALMLTALAGGDSRDPTSLPGHPGDYQRGLDEGVAGLRCAFWVPADADGVGQSDGAENVEVAALAWQAAGVLAVHGAEVAETTLSLGASRYAEAFRCMNEADRYALQGREIMADPARRELLTPYVAERFVRSAATPADQYVLALRTRFEAVREMDAAFQRYDLLLSPTVGFTAPPEPEDWQARPADLTSRTYLANFCGLPAMSVPCGVVGGLPAGLQLMAPAGQEVRLLRAARVLEHGLPVAEKPNLDGFYQTVTSS